MKKLISLLAILLLAAGDQAIKLLVVENLKPLGSISVIPGFLDFTYVENRGVAFGMFSGMRWLVVAITCVLCLALLLVLLFYRGHTGLSSTACVLVIAGGLGNIIDRMLYGFVVDYIAVSFFPPVFNFADCCVVIGVILLLIHFLFFHEEGGPREKLICTRPHDYRTYKR